MADKEIKLKLDFSGTAAPLEEAAKKLDEQVKKSLGKDLAGSMTAAMAAASSKISGTFQKIIGDAMEKAMAKFKPAMALGGGGGAPRRTTASSMPLTAKELKKIDAAVAEATGSAAKGALGGVRLSAQELKQLKKITGGQSMATILSQGTVGGRPILPATSGASGAVSSGAGGLYSTTGGIPQISQTNVADLFGLRGQQLRKLAAIESQRLSKTTRKASARLGASALAERAKKDEEAAAKKRADVREAERKKEEKKEEKQRQKEADADLRDLRKRLKREEAEKDKARKREEAAIEKANPLVERLATPEEKRREALKSINQELESQERQLRRINTLLVEPGKLQKHVAGELGLEKAEKRLAFERRRERGRQMGPMEALADVFGLSSGMPARFLNDLGGRIAGVGAAIEGPQRRRKSRIPSVLPAEIPSVLPAPGGAKPPPLPPVAKVVPPPLPIPKAIPVPLPPVAKVVPPPIAATSRSTARSPLLEKAASLISSDVEQALLKDIATQRKRSPLMEKMAQTPEAKEAAQAIPVPLPPVAKVVPPPLPIPKAIPVQLPKGLSLAGGAAGGGGRKPPVLSSLGGAAGGGGGMFGKLLGGARGAIGGALGALGGGLAAAAGPIGLAVAGAMMLKKAVTAVATAPFKVISGGLAIVNKSMKEMTGPIGILGAALSHLESVFQLGGKIGGIFGKVSEAMGDVVGQVSAFLKMVPGIVQSFSPAKVKLFDLALNDAAAVLGERLTPVLELMTDVVRTLADFLEAVLPSGAEVKAALEPVREAFKELRKTLAPVAQQLRGAFTKALIILAAVLKAAVMGLKELLSGLVDTTKAAGASLPDTRGKGGQPAAFKSVEEYAKGIYTAALNVGRESKDPAVESAGYLKKISEKVKEIADYLKGGVSGAASGAKAGTQMASGDFLGAIQTVRQIFGWGENP